jgi:hypothetical protein
VKRLLLHTWFWLRRDLHNFDFTQEPESQKHFRAFIVRGVRAMEYNPHTQWRYHLAMSWVWLASAPPILMLFFFYPEQWLRWGLLITLLYSLYANFATDLGGLHAAWAAYRGDQISTKQDVQIAEEHITTVVQETTDEVIDRIERTDDDGR